MRSIIEADPHSIHDDIEVEVSTMILKLKLSSLKEPLAIHSVFVIFLLTTDEHDLFKAN